jgi:predicted outer membrane repeat protein
MQCTKCIHINSSINAKIISNLAETAGGGIYAALIAILGRCSYERGLPKKTKSK